MIKKLFLAAISAAALFSGCKENEDAASLFVKPVTGSELIKMDDANLTGKVDLDQIGGTVAFEVQTNQVSGWNFVLGEEAEWCDVSKQDGKLTIVVGENRSVVERTQTVTVKAGTSDYMMAWVITVTQAPADLATVKINPGKLELNANGESIDVIVTTEHKNWSVISPQSMWITLIKDEDGGKFTVMVPRNGKSTPIKGVITLIVGEEDNSAQVDIPVTQLGQPPVKVTVSPTSIPFSIQGGVVDVTVTLENATNFQMQCQETWLKIEKTPTGARVTAAPNYSSASYTASLMIGAGDSDNNDVKVISITQPANTNAGSMILEYTLPETTASLIGYWVGLPFAKVGAYTVDWGDGSAVETYSSAYPKHKYATAGVYNVTVSGVVTQITLYNMGVMKPDASEGTNTAALQERLGYLTAVKSWGNTGLTTLVGAFSGNRNLQYVAADTEGAFSKVASVNKMFEQKSNKDYPPMGTLTIAPDLFKFIPGNVSPAYLFYNVLTMENIPENILDPFTQATSVDNCFYKTGIAEVPEHIFDKLTKLTNVTNVFSSCDKLTTVPENLFANNPEITLFNGAFQSCTELTTIPENLFASNRKATSFNMTFHTSGLTSIPARLFANNTAGTSFLQCFYYCSSLSAIPANLFDNNRKVTSFQMTFSYCSATTGESPYTMINSKKVHLYERNDYPEEFTKVTAMTKCFLSCTALDDYATIPATWK